MSAPALRQQLDAGALTAQAHVRSLLSTIEAQEADVQAWAFLDPALALAQAHDADARLAAGDRSPLLGLAVGLKDIIDTSDMPTENGTVLHAGRRPSHDAALVQRLRRAGAVIMGKTVTTELATYAPGKTRNPHRLTHTPGGSSSGSAAAVACGMVPLAVGSQTNGSTIRPGSYCGVVSFKPTRALIDRTGMLVQSPTFDTVGLFAADVGGIQLLLRALANVHLGADGGGPAAGPPLRLAWLSGALSTHLEPGVETKLLKQAQAWGAVEVPAGAPCDMQTLIELHREIMEAEIARSFATEHAQGAERLSASLRGQIERGRNIDDARLAEACQALTRLQQSVDRWMNTEGVDAFVMPSAAGGAPRGLESTGNPAFCTFATALDLPALQLPMLSTDDGLPLGIQVVARRGADEALLAWGSLAAT